MILNDDDGVISNCKNYSKHGIVANLFTLLCIFNACQAMPLIDGVGCFNLQELLFTIASFCVTCWQYKSCQLSNSAPVFFWMLVSQIAMISPNKDKTRVGEYWPFFWRFQKIEFFVEYDYIFFYCVLKATPHVKYFTNLFASLCIFNAQVIMQR